MELQVGPTIDINGQLIPIDQSKYAELLDWIKNNDPTQRVHLHGLDPNNTWFNEILQNWLDDSVRIYFNFFLFCDLSNNIKT